jgi:hypothetical protein
MILQLPEIIVTYMQGVAVAAYIMRMQKHARLVDFKIWSVLTSLSKRMHRQIEGHTHTHTHTRGDVYTHARGDVYDCKSVHSHGISMATP